MTRQFLLGGLAALFLATAASAEDVKIQKISALMKSKVLIQEDAERGKIVDVVISDGGCVDYVVASYEDEYYVVPYSAVELRPANSVVYVDISPAQFREVHFFSGNSWPDLYASDFRQQVFTTFNVSNFRSNSTTVNSNTNINSSRNDTDVNVRNRNTNVNTQNRDRDDNRGNADTRRNANDNARDRNDRGENARDRADNARDRTDNRRDAADDRRDTRDNRRDATDNARDRADNARDRADSTRDRADNARDRAEGARDSATPRTNRDSNTQPDGERSVNRPNSGASKNVPEAPKPNSAGGSNNSSKEKSDAPKDAPKPKTPGTVPR